MRKVMLLQPRLYVTDIHGVMQRDISSYIDSGKVTMNQDARTALTFRANLRRDPELVPWRDYLKPTLRTVWNDGTVKESPIGLYVVPPHPRVHTRAETSASIDGRDLTFLLANSAFAYVYSISRSDDALAKVIEIVTSCGIDASRVIISRRSSTTGTTADLPIQLTSDRDWEPNVPKLTIINDVLNTLGYYTMHPDLSGNLLVKPSRDIAAAEPDAHYGSGANAMITGEISDDPSDSSFCNVVIVTAGSPAARDSAREIEIPAGADPETATMGIGAVARVTQTANLRSSATTGADVVSVLPVNQPVKISGNSTGSGADEWWPAETYVKGVGVRSGWIGSRYLELDKRATVANVNPAVDSDLIPIPPIIAVRRNDDPDSPTSTVSLGWIDPVTETLYPREIVRMETPSNIETQAQAEEMANRLLQESLSFYRRLEITTLPDPGRSMHEIYELNIENRAGTVIDGKWWCRGWELGFTTKDPVMRHTLHRVEDWQWEGAAG